MWTRVEGDEDNGGTLISNNVQGFFKKWRFAVLDAAPFQSWTDWDVRWFSGTLTPALFL